MKSNLLNLERISRLPNTAVLVNHYTIEIKNELEHAVIHYKTTTHRLSSKVGTKELNSCKLLYYFKQFLSSLDFVMM